MKLFLLLTDLVILSIYGVYALISYQPDFGFILMILLFFLAARVLALAVHPALSILNLGLMYFLLPYHPAILLLSYLFYAALYAYLSQREGERSRLTRENTQLKIARKNSLRYQFLKENYEHQVALNLRLDERRQIAQRIHDLLGHSLTASALQMEAAAELMEQDPAKAKDLLGSAAGLLRNGISQVREAVHQMRADVPQMKKGELQALVNRFRLDSGIVTSYQEEGELEDLPGGIWNVLTGNLREALTNVIRHSGAARVDIRLQALPGMIRLEVKDDGQGARAVREGMGISGMRERAAEYGGSLIVRGDGGMTVITLIPRKEADDDTRGGD